MTNPKTLSVLGAAALCVSACATVPSTSETPPKFAAADAALRADQLSKTVGVLVLKRGEPIYEAYFGEGSATRLNDTRSATKTLVAMAVGIAHGDGTVPDLDKPIWPLFAAEYPDVPADAAIREATWRDLMTMSSSLACDDNNDTPGNEEKMYPEENWTDFVIGLPRQANWQRDSEGLGSFRYCTAGSFFLGQALERATGVPIDEYVGARLFEPLHVTNAKWFHSPSGEVQTGGGLELTVRALGALSNLLLSDGRSGDKQVLPAGWASQMTTPWRDGFLEMRYGYQIWNRSYPTPCGQQEAWFMAGNGGSHVMAFPDLDAVIVLVRELYNTDRMHQQSWAFTEKFLLPELACKN